MANAAASPAKKGRKPRDGAKKKVSKPTHPPTLEMITRAILTEKDPKGTSVMAIKKHIMANNKIKSAQLLNHMLRRAFEAGLAAGKLARPRGQADTTLLAGRYRLAGKEKKAKAVVAKPRRAVRSPAKKPKSPAKKAVTKKPKAKTPKKKPAVKKAKSPKKPTAKKTPKKSPKKAAPKKKTPKKAGRK